ncbi:MAG TPA: hypothetical protein VM221_11060 [Armatimonadota bacterium]|nr:hypothetical protein [Armatimonadota bacterium]
MTAPNGPALKVARALYSPGLDEFIIQQEHGPWYAVRMPTRRAEFLMPEGMDYVALGADRERHVAVFVACESRVLSARHEWRGTPSVALYPPRDRRARVLRLALPRGRILRYGAITRDGRSAVLCYQEYPWLPTKCRLCDVDLATGAIKHTAALPLQPELAVYRANILRTSRADDGEVLLVATESSLFTLSLDHFILRTVPGGPWPMFTDVDVTGKSWQALVATWPDAGIWVVDLHSGTRRLLGKAAGRGWGGAGTH